MRAGDARNSVDLHVDVAREGGTLSTRKITARQDGQILLEALASFNLPFDSLDYQQPMPDVADPDSLAPMQELLAAHADELGGHWVAPRPFELRYVDDVQPPGTNGVRRDSRTLFRPRIRPGLNAYCVSPACSESCLDGC